MVIQNMVLPPKRQGRSLSEWFQTTAGADLLEKENTLLKKVLPELFGYHLLWTGEGNYWSGVAASSVAHHVRLQAPDKSAAKDCDVIGSHTSLPVQRDSIDVVILPHLLEYDRHPHAILREAERVLHPNGHIIILGFNPVGYHGFCRVLSGFRGNMPWQGHFYHPLRIRDWLKLLGFVVKSVSYTAFLPSIRYGKMARCSRFIEKAGQGMLAPLSGVYMITARNLIVASNVIKPGRSRKKAVLDGVVEPTTRICLPNKRLREV